MAKTEKLPNTGLVALAQESAALSRELMETDGELTPEMEARLALTGESLPRKVDQYQFVMQEFTAQQELWKQRKDEAAAAEKRFSAKIDGMKQRLRAAMVVLETDELRGELYRFKLASTVGRLEIHDEKLIPAQYWYPMPMLDKQRLKADIQSGITIPGAEIVQEPSLRTYTAGKGEKS